MIHCISQDTSVILAGYTGIRHDHLEGVQDVLRDPPATLRQGPPEFIEGPVVIIISSLN